MLSAFPVSKMLKWTLKLEYIEVKEVYSIECHHTIVKGDKFLKLSLLSLAQNLMTANKIEDGEID